MITSAPLLKDLQKRVTVLEDDLRRRCDADPPVNAPLHAQYEAARSNRRTAETFNAWRDEQLTQIAVAWVLACVFVRFLEDNQLLDAPFLAGPDTARMNRARDEQELFFKGHPTASERDYLLHVFGAVGQLPGMREFFDRRHNPLWLAGPTGDALAGLLDFWRKTDPDTGALAHDFTDPDWNTRFLGDLYQDLSEFARKRYALLQTPEFVEQFILDRALTPAIEVFGYRVVRMLDLTCGSGHFLLGGFDRLFRLWQEHEPGENPRVLAQHALDQVCGVDLNPNVIAIARFRLLLAALRVSGVTRLKDAPNFQIHLAVGDSLLHGARFHLEEKQAKQQTFGGDELFRDELQHFYETEDRDALHRILGRQYHVVVGNPPYITVKDKALNQLYRDRFDSCHRKYSLAAPFMERFFDFAIRGEPAMKWDPFADQRKESDAQAGQIRNPKSEIRSPAPAGYVGMITSNSFMKREFGKKLIEECIPRWDLTHVIDTAGAYVPGHGTPTVILFAKHQPPVTATIRAVMGIKGEPATPEDPAHGQVWSAILRQVDQPGSESDFVSVADTARENFHKHPWSIGGGGAAELKELLDETVEKTLEDVTEDAGFMAIISEDDAFLGPVAHFHRNKIPQRLFITGDCVRDWTAESGEAVTFPYDDSGVQISVTPLSSSAILSQTFWPNRVPLSARKMFGKTPVEHGLAWYQFIYLTPKRFLSPQFLAFASVGTHNHFSLMRRGNVLNRHAPVVVLPANATEPDHFALLGLLNSSTACFWMKQIFHNKGSTVDQHGARQRTAAFEDFFEFDGTKLAAFPVPAEKPLALARELDRLAQELKAHAPAAVLAQLQFTNLKLQLAEARAQWTGLLQRMIALQEELDWECYRVYGVASDEWRVTSTQDFWSSSELPPLYLGERAFEIVMARKMARGELQTSWFERHGSTPSTELPTHWPTSYRAVVERRIALIGRDRNIALIEQPEYKRRWNVEPWAKQEERSLRQWLLNWLEGYFFEGDRVCRLEDGFSPAGHGFLAATRPALVSTNQLAEVVQADATFLKVAEVYAGAAGFSVSKLVRELVESESVPFLPFQRYKESGLRKRQDWERTWDLQRREDEFDGQIEPLTKELEDVVKKLSNNADSSQVPKWTARKEELGEEIRALKDDKARGVGVIPVPPKYASADFKSSTFWRLRGKLDVPKERWISYPGAEREGDPSPVIAWAGWTHLQQAQALAEYYLTAKDTWGWPPERLQLLLSGLADLLPWLKQWHNNPNPEYGMGLGDYFAGFLDEECRKNGTTVETAQAMRLGSK